MEVTKSSRHSKITGDFAEALVLYWLSKYGFECARVDHTGIDLIARNPTTNEIMGVSVKSRSRTSHTANDSITIPADNFTKAQKASDAFGCVPYFAIVVDAKETIRVFITSMAHFMKVFPVRQHAAYWKVSRQYLNKHLTDDKIMVFQFEAKTIRWWKTPTT
jgi:Holliday junction resolvase-like predicted endonuclease